MKALRLLIRTLIFLALMTVCASIIFIFGRTIIYDFLQIAPDDYSRPAIILEIVVLALLAVIFFCKIVLQKSVKTPVIGLSFYLACHIVAILLVTFNQPNLAPAFEWLALIGLITFFVIKPFKKKMLDENEDTAENGED